MSTVTTQAAPAAPVKFGIAMHAIEKSSNLEAQGYCASTQRMALQYRGGRIYHYKEVPKHVYDAFLAAPSLGSFAAREIQGKYDGEPMKTAIGPTDI